MTGDDMLPPAVSSDQHQMQQLLLLGEIKGHTKSIHEGQIRQEARIDQMSNDMRSLRQEMHDKIDGLEKAHDSRLSSLEGWRMLVYGAWLVLAIMGAAAWKMLTGI